MNIAFPAVVLVLLILPGYILLRVRIRTSDRSVVLPPSMHAFSTEAAKVVSYAIAIHVIWYFLIQSLLYKFISDAGVEMQPNAVLMFLTGKYGPSDNEFDWAIDCVTKYKFHVATYFLGLYAFSWVIAITFCERIDRVCGALNMHPAHEATQREWDAFFRYDDRETYKTYVTMVIEIANDAYLIGGEVDNIYFDRGTGKLDRIVLKNAVKKKYGETEGKFARIHPGELFSVSLEDLNTLNVMDTEPTKKPVTGPIQHDALVIDLKTQKPAPLPPLSDF